MKLIQDQIIKEKMEDKPDKYRILKLQSIVDSGSLSYEDFRESGRFTPMEVYKSKNKKAKLHKDCTEVVTYFGGFIIQALKSGVFFFEYTKEKHDITIEHRTLDVVEAVLWTLVANKKINN